MQKLAITLAKKTISYRLEAASIVSGSILLGYFYRFAALFQKLKMLCNRRMPNLFSIITVL